MGQTRAGKRPTLSALKKSFHSEHIKHLKKEIEQRDQVIEAIKTDPQGAIAPFIEQMKQVREQNNRLTALVASLIEDQGPITLPIDKVESFHGFKVDITFDLNQETKEVTFKMKKEAIPQQSTAVEDIGTVTLSESNPEYALQD